MEWEVSPVDAVWGVTVVWADESIKGLLFTQVHVMVLGSGRVAGGGGVKTGHSGSR